MLQMRQPAKTQPQKVTSTLSRHLEELCKAGALERHRDGEHALLDYVDSEARDLSPDAFSRFMVDLYSKIAALISKSNDVIRRLGGVLAIDDLIDVKTGGDDAAKTSRLALLLSRSLEDADDPLLIDMAAHTLGRLVRCSGAMTSDIVEREIKRALSWCDPKVEPLEIRRLAGVLLLREMAEAAPAVFNVHVKGFIDAIWHPLRDPRLNVREAAVAALKACLVLVEKRETRYRVQWYYKLFEQTMRGLHREQRSGASPSPDAIHGSLMALGELLQHTGEFLLARYKEVVETVLRFKDSKEKQIRRAVIVLLPRMAAFSPERFAYEYLAKAIGHLLTVLKLQPERGAAFSAIADMACALSAVGCAQGFDGCLQPISYAIREALATRLKSKGQCPEALQCVGSLSQALGQLWKPYAATLIEPMVQTGLSETLVVALTQIATALPELLESIQYQALDLLSLALSKRPFNPYTAQPKWTVILQALALGGWGLARAPENAACAHPSTSPPPDSRARVWAIRGVEVWWQSSDAALMLRMDAGCCVGAGVDALAHIQGTGALVWAVACDVACRLRAAAIRELQGSALTRLALQTIGSFEFGRVNLLEFMRDYILPYTEDTDKEIRQAAVLACCRVLERHAGALRKEGGVGAHGSAANVRHTRVVEKVVTRLLVAAVADPSERVRLAVLKALAGSTSLDDYLAQADCLRSLFVALNDESSNVRALTVKLVGRLSGRNPAYVNPALRRHLQQLLTDIEHSPDSKHREESAYLLEVLITSAAPLIMPYVAPIQKVLVAKLRAGGPSGSAATAAAAATTHGPASMAAAPKPKDGGKGGKGSRGEAPSENAVVRTVLSTIGALAAVSHSAFRPYVAEVMPLVIDAIQDTGSARKRIVAVKTLGQIVENTGTVMTPYLDFPQLLSILLRMLHEGSPVQRKEVMKVLGIVGALDPHMHKTNQASLSGEGKLDLEGVRPLRFHQSSHAGGPEGGRAGGGGGGGGGEGGASPTMSSTMGTHPTTGDGDASADLLPSSGLVTSSEEFYPTVAINALMRVLRDPSYASQHMTLVIALMSIFKALGLTSVPYLHKVLPVLFSVLRRSDDPLREEMLQQLTRLVSYVRQHIRRFLPDMLGLLHEFWDASTRTCLTLLAELSIALHDDFRQYIPELLPRFVGLFAEAERSGAFDLLKPALAALEALGSAVEEHLHLLLPALVRLINPAQSSTPVEIRRIALVSMRKLLPRMQLNGYTSAVLQPLIKVLDGTADDLRKHALDAICAMAIVLGPGLDIFLPSIRKVQHIVLPLGTRPPGRCPSLTHLLHGPSAAVSQCVIRHSVKHDWFETLSGTKVSDQRPPCMSDVAEWEGSSGWAAEVELAAKMHEGGGGRAAATPGSRPWHGRCRVWCRDRRAGLRTERGQGSPSEGDIRRALSHITPSSLPEMTAVSQHPVNPEPCMAGTRERPLTTPQKTAVKWYLCQRAFLDVCPVCTHSHSVCLPPAPPKMAVNPLSLRRAWESSQRVTKEDWAEWMRHFSVELLRESPSPALRACHGLAQVHPSMARELFAAGFVACWSELDPVLQEQLVRSLEAALASPTIPPETVTALLNLAEFMEHDDKRLPLDTRTLGALAEKCHAFAKALHYKELEFQTSPLTATEALIHINNQLRQPEAAVGVLTFAQKNLNMELKESWYEKLCRWDEALEAYERRLGRERAGSVEHQGALLGKMRCLASLAEWETLSSLCRVEWGRSESHMRREMSVIAAHASWHMESWDEMGVYVDTLDAPDLLAPTATGAFLRAVLSTHHSEYANARLHVDRARELMATEFAALVGESYERAYSDMVRVQQLAELEEVVEVKIALDREAGRKGALSTSLSAQPSSLSASCDPWANKVTFVKQLWKDRLRGVRRNVEVWQSLFSIRHLVVPLSEDVPNWLKFASLCRKSGRSRQAHRILLALLRYDPATRAPSTPGYGAGSGAPNVMLAYLKHIWMKGQRPSAYSRLKEMVVEIQSLPEELPPPVIPPPPAPMDVAAAAATAAAVAAASDSTPGSPSGNNNLAGAAGMQAGDLNAQLAVAQQTAAALAAAAARAGGAINIGGGVAAGGLSATWRLGEKPRTSLKGRAYLRLGLWQWSMNDGLDNAGVISDVLGALRCATEAAPQWAKAWHQWALFNVAVMTHYSAKNENEAAASRVAPAVHGFFKSVALGQASGDRTGNLQDILRLLTLWFNHGHYTDVERELTAGFGLVSIDTWLSVIPQIIARIHTNNSTVRGLIHTLLVTIGKHHPQALMYPLLVATKSQSVARRNAAFSVLDQIRQHSATLVEQAQLVSTELIRMAILWQEMWHEGLEEASRLYFGESNVEGMLNTLLPLHDLMKRNGPSTLKEMAFVQTYGVKLDEAYEWLSKYRSSRKEAELHQAWDLYYHVFKRINKQLHALTTLELQFVAPALVRAQGMELAVPGTYIVGEPLVTIAAFAPQLHVISSKQRPRKLTIHGGDGAEYMFLLKGHEDLRQDERVMQLFGLVNSMLSHDRVTSERDLSIARYAVIPLSPNSGLIGWVPNCDTLHALIREFREARKIPLNWEHRLMLGMAPDYDHLTVIQKVEVFEYALEATSGDDLHKVLWLKSRNSEVWLDRRTNYTRSAAVMSMVGYILGLGDRHPSNLMLDRYSGKLLHIDFGDCFEASMNREKFPEKVPFRLTRMMSKAMEVSGIEGNFRTTCESVMRVLRGNKESVTAMLEAFVHDPLINWRLLNTTEAATEAALAREHETGAARDRTGDHTSKVVAGTPASVWCVTGFELENPPHGRGSAHGRGAPSPPWRRTTQPAMVACASDTRVWRSVASAALAWSQALHAATPGSKRSLAPDAPLATHTVGWCHDDLIVSRRASTPLCGPGAPAHGPLDGAAGGASAAGAGLPSPPRRDTREMREVFANMAETTEAGLAARDVLNTRAVEVMKRMADKLMGRDFAAEGSAASAGDSDSVPAQVQRLISQAISHENLCQSYIGWCPFW
ncbi:MAG: hypothetical protein WDW36_005122 [Sanguina aurantia]